MIGFNLLIMLAYIANAYYFCTRLQLPRGHELWALVAKTCAGVFFITCAIAHLGLAVAIYRSDTQWLFSWWMLVDNGMLAPAGLLFVAIAWHKLNLTLVGEADIERRNLESFRAALMDNAVSPVITTNSDGRILDWNKAAETIFLYSHAEVIGRSLMDLIGLGEIEGIQECRLQTATGKIITAEVGTRRFRTTKGIVVVAFIRDISARVEAERGRRRALGRLLHAEQESRAQIAVELHDDTIQVMAATLMKLDVCEMRMKELGAACSNGDAKPFEEYQALLVSAVFTLRQAMTRTRRMMFELRPPELTDASLEVAILSLAREIDREVHTFTTVDIDIGRQPEEIERLVYRVILEALTNIRKHAHATQVAIHLSYADGSLHGSVEDDGTGFNVVSTMDKTDRHLHLGIGSCQERVKLAGGSYFVISNPDQGTTVNFEIPTSHDGLSWQTLYDMIA